MAIMRRPRRYSASRRGSRGGAGGSAFERFGQAAANIPGVVPVGPDVPIPPTGPDPFTGIGGTPVAPTTPGVLPAPGTVPGAGGTTGVVAPLPNVPVAATPYTGPTPAPVVTPAPVDTTTLAAPVAAAPVAGAPAPGGPQPASAISGSDLNQTNSSAAGTGAEVPQPMANSWSGSEGTPTTPQATMAPSQPVAPNIDYSQRAAERNTAPAPAVPQNLVWSSTQGWVTPEQFIASWRPAAPAAAVATGGVVPPTSWSGSDQNPGSGPVIAPMPAVTNPVSPQSSWSGSDVNPTNSSLIAPQQLTADQWMQRLTTPGGDMLTFDRGGIIAEPVIGIGLVSKRRIFIAANGQPEMVSPLGSPKIQPAPAAVIPANAIAPSPAAPRERPNADVI